MRLYASVGSLDDGQALWRLRAEYGVEPAGGVLALLEPIDALTRALVAARGADDAPRPPPPPAPPVPAPLPAAEQPRSSADLKRACATVAALDAAVAEDEWAPPPSRTPA